MNFKLKDIGPQLMTVIAVVLVFGFFTYNAQVNMENRGIDFGYGLVSVRIIARSVFENSSRKSHLFFQTGFIRLLSTKLSSCLSCGGRLRSGPCCSGLDSSGLWVLSTV